MYSAFRLVKGEYIQTHLLVHSFKVNFSCVKCNGKWNAIPGLLRRRTITFDLSLTVQRTKKLNCIDTNPFSNNGVENCSFRSFVTKVPFSNQFSRYEANKDEGGPIWNSHQGQRHSVVKYQRLEQPYYKITHLKIREQEIMEKPRPRSKLIQLL